jgi:hypothetical protein
MIFYFIPLGSIGPAVPLTWIINSLLIPFALTWCFADIDDDTRRRGWMIAAVPIGLVVAYLQFLSYMVITPWFELNDFDWL